MLTDFYTYLTFENIYLWANFGILPFWIMLIFIPNWRITKILINSIIIPLILGITYIYIIYQMMIIDEISFSIFNLYLGLDALYSVFSIEGILLIFWIHFITINIFIGCWISKDGLKYSLPQILIAISLIITYLMGPLGLIFYWIIRIFSAKKLGFHD